MLKKNRGSMFVFFAVGLPILLAFVAFALDVGYMLLVKNQLQNGADAAALAGARRLGCIYAKAADCNIAGETGSRSFTYGTDDTLVITAASEVASANRAAGTNIVISDTDVVIGNMNKGTFTANGSPANAVRVTARSPGVHMFFARVLGIDTFDSSAVATAALTPQSGGKPGAPFAISYEWFNNHTCGTEVVWSGSTACAAWTTFGEDANANNLKNSLDSLYIGGSLPMATVGDTEQFTNGAIGAAMNRMADLFDMMKIKNNDNLGDYDSDSTTWTTYVLVADFKCGEGNKPSKILGFAKLKFKQVVTTSGGSVSGTVECEIKTTPGGGNYGFVTGTTPSLAN